MKAVWNITDDDYGCIEFNYYVPLTYEVSSYNWKWDRAKDLKIRLDNINMDKFISCKQNLNSFLDLIKSIPSLPTNYSIGTNSDLFLFFCSEENKYKQENIPKIIINFVFHYRVSPMSLLDNLYIQQRSGYKLITNNQACKLFHDIWRLKKIHNLYFLGENLDFLPIIGENLNLSIGRTTIFKNVFYQGEFEYVP